MGEEATRMDELAEAWDAVAEDENTEETTDGTQDQQSDGADSGGAIDGPDGGPEEHDDEPADDTVVQAGEGDAAQEQDGATDKPPVGLSPAAREAWGDVPDAVKSEITKREADYEKGIMKYAENAKRAEQMDQVLGPYQQLFAMNGGPGQTLPGLLQTASLLQMGSPQQKAQQVAALIQQFGVDVATLDSVLVGQAPPDDPNQNIQQLVDQRFQQYQQQLHAHQQQQNQAVIQSEVHQFASDPKNEFYKDVSSQMADMMELYSMRNQPLTLEQAYEQCCQMNPQIRQILEARTAQASVNQKRQAAASVSGTPSGPGDTNAPTSRLAALEEAWDNAGRM
jgi:hypothetical protein